MSWTRRGVYRQYLTARTHAHIFLVACHFSHISSNAHALAQDVWAIQCVSLKSSHPRTMSLLGVPEFSAFPPVLSLSAAPPTLLAGIRLNPCTTPLWGGPSGHLADPIPNTDYEPKFCIDVSSELTPTNLPSRKSSFNLENDATIAASEDFDLPQHSTSLNIQERAAAGTR